MRRLYILVLALVAVVALLIVVFHREREPEYGGKRLSEWVDQMPPVGMVIFSGAGPFLTVPEFRDREVDQMVVAFQQMGTNAIPYLLAWMQYEPPTWKTRYLEAMSKVFHRPFVDHRTLRAYRAAKALSRLGEKAEPAVPHLARLMHDAKPGGTAARSEAVLAALGDKLISADLALMTNFSGWQRQRAIHNAARMGTNARPAIPVLRGLVQSSDVAANHFARHALRQIDPEALERDTE